MLPIILASSSSYRSQLLAKLHLPFSCCSPNINESILEGESPLNLVKRLSKEKAEAISFDNRNHLIIASDQVACLEGKILNKPGNHKNAVKQLAASSGKKVSFLTGLVLLNTKTGFLQQWVEPFSVKFRTLSAQQIERYLALEPSYDCAGSFKMEGLGIALFEHLQGDDPNSLVGLPLIKLIDLLANEGIDVLGPGPPL